MEIPTFRPTDAEFLDFEKYMTWVSQHLRDTNKTVGLARIIPPQAWLDSVLLSEERLGERLKGYTVKMPVKQKVEKVSDKAFKLVNEVVSSRMPLERFKAECEVQEKSCSKLLEEVCRTSFKDVSNVFWNSMGNGATAMYGADSPGTLFQDSLSTWNLNKLPSILRVLGTEISGVTHSYLYFGMWKALFAAHTEDMELFSINFLHEGAAKMWYAVPPSSADKFERMAASIFPDDHKRCAQFLRHKLFMLSPELLRAHEVPFCCGAQSRGEFMVTFPRSYHFGFNAGPNIAEAVNFALDSWIPFGKEAVPCKCHSDSVRIDMEIFLFRYINELRSCGRLPTEPTAPEWRFECPCGMNVSSEDPEYLWPCKPQFQCDSCQIWVHLECHDLKQVGQKEFCYYCTKSMAKKQKIGDCDEIEDE
jgi:jumonji domain-containing protein 2